MLRYFARFHPEASGFSVSFRDIPEALTQGDTIEEARDMAADALLTAMDFYFEQGRAVPSPSDARRGEEAISLPASVAAKVALLNEMVAQKIRPADLARQLGTSPQAVTRLLDLNHTTKIDALDEALQALGKNLVVAAG